jgi:hypothetical protein
LETGISQTIFLGWPLTVILPISIFLVARNTGLNHWHLAVMSIVKKDGFYHQHQGTMFLLKRHQETEDLVLDFRRFFFILLRETGYIRKTKM